MAAGSDFVVRPEHVRQSGMCMRGVRAWAERYGIDYRGFLMNGITIGELEAIGDPLGMKVVEYIREKEIK